MNLLLPNLECPETSKSIYNQPTRKIITFSIILKFYFKTPEKSAYKEAQKENYWQAKAPPMDHELTHFISTLNDKCNPSFRLRLRICRCRIRPVSRSSKLLIYSNWKEENKDDVNFILFFRHRCCTLSIFILSS